MRSEGEIIKKTKEIWDLTKHRLTNKQLWEVAEKYKERLVCAWALEELARRGDERKSN